MVTAFSMSGHHARPGSIRPEVRAFWTGPQLSPYEELSLRSFVASGARVLVYSSELNLRVPDGVELVDLRELMSGGVHQFTFADGDRSPALHSDLFRYEAIHRYGNWYVDLDVVLLRDRLPDTKVYLAHESPEIVNGAIMKFPAGSPVVTAAIERATELLPETRAGAPLSRRISIGPALVTSLVQDYALDHLVRPRSSAYEITYDEIPAMFDPYMREELEERVANSDFVHLWNEIWRRVRIPKSYGPPKGSFLDGLFRRFGMDFSAEARLSADTIAAWFAERRLLTMAASHLQTGVLPNDAFERLVKRIRGDAADLPPGAAQQTAGVAVAEPQVKSAPASKEPVRTFWQGGSIGPYQLLALRSFVDRGYPVELFTYDTGLVVPDWIAIRSAADIVPAERVLRHLPDQQRSAINGNLFRHALLYKLGGWWVDPDVILLSRELPGGDVFIAGPNEFKTISTAAIKIGAADPALSDALVQSAPFDEAVAEWNRLGAPLLTRCLATHGRLNDLQPAEQTSPVSWFGVADLFDPDQTGNLVQKLAKKSFLQLHTDAWLRAGIPFYLGPPLGSYLDKLYGRHDVGLRFPARMEFDDVRRWLAHMYACLKPALK
jgi:hypothetical protein